MAIGKTTARQINHRVWSLLLGVSLVVWYFWLRLVLEPGYSVDEEHLEEITVGVILTVLDILVQPSRAKMECSPGGGDST